MSKDFDFNQLCVSLESAFKLSESRNGDSHLVRYNSDSKGRSNYGYISEHCLHEGGYKSLASLYDDAEICIRVENDRVTILRVASAYFESAAFGAIDNVIKKRGLRASIPPQQEPESGLRESAIMKQKGLKPLSDYLKEPEMTFRAAKSAPTLAPNIELPWQQRNREAAEQRAAIVALRNQVRSTLGM